MNLTELKTRPAAALIELGESLGVENLARSRKQDIIFLILKAHAKNGEDIYGDGGSNVRGADNGQNPFYLITSFGGYSR